MKTSIAQSLIERFTRPRQVLLDPFAGSGVIPFEAAMLGRETVACDTNPYGVLLTRAKFSAPDSCSAALALLQKRWDDSLRRKQQDLRRVPVWVRSFFHPKTLRAALALRDELAEAGDNFLLACLLGILHHQRPGFLSYPSSHLVPYLRDKKFPRDKFASMYRERDVYSRMVAKVVRAYRRSPGSLASSQIHLCDARSVTLPTRVDAIVTSPPYMNELDYVRDNRLRLWFIERHLPSSVDIPRGKREQQFCSLLRETFQRLVPVLAPGAPVVIVVGDTRRGGTRRDAASSVKTVFEGEAFAGLQYDEEFHDLIPDIRRSRRELAGTKRETVLVYRKSPWNNVDAKTAT